MSLTPWLKATEIRAFVRSGESSVTRQVEFFLKRIAALNGELNCYTDVQADRALQRATALDEELARGNDPGPLTGVPFAVKNLFDIEGVTTLAGSKINADHPAAARDAVLISRLEEAGAVLVGALAMGEYAYDFTGENEHYGACRNPWGTHLMSGGSSSGSGSATAAGLAPLSLGSDTNGSIRVPASLCGLFGLKPTYGRLPRTGTFPFCDSLDHLGPLARSARDLAVCFDALQGWDAHDPACVPQKNLTTEQSLEQGLDGLKIVRAGGYFDCTDFPEAEAALNQVAGALGVSEERDMEGAEAGRAAAYLITNAESSQLHRHRIQTRIQDFDTDTRDRFLAGTLIPANWYLRAQAVRRWWHERMLAVFDDCDVILAPATPCPAPAIGTKVLMVHGKEQMLRPNLGLFTQPFSAIGLPVCTVPVWTEGATLPIGVQIVAAPWREDICLRVAHALESMAQVECRNPVL